MSGDPFGWQTVVDALIANGISDAESAFKYVDKDGGGTISYAELLAAVEELGLAGTAEDCQRMMREADANGDGEVSLDEFLAWQVKVHAENEAYEDEPPRTDWGDTIYVPSAQGRLQLDWMAIASRAVLPRGDPRRVPGRRSVRDHVRARCAGSASESGRWCSRPRRRPARRPSRSCPRGARC